MKLKGIVKYDDKHDVFFIQGSNKSVYSLYTENTLFIEPMLGKEVTFLANSANEVTNLSIKVEE